MFGVILKATDSSFLKDMTFAVAYSICEESYETTCIHI